MKKLLIILCFYSLVSENSYAQILPFNVDAKKDTALLIPLSKSDCEPNIYFNEEYLSIPPQAPFFYVSIGYYSNCGTIDRMKAKITSDTIYLIQSDSGNIFTCNCWRFHAFIFQNYQHDSCTVIFGNLSGVYHNPMAGLNENAQNVNAIQISNPFNDILHINISDVFNNNSFYSMELYTIDGRKIRTENLFKPNIDLNTQNLKQGIYLAIIRKNGIVVNSKKLIKV